MKENLEKKKKWNGKIYNKNNNLEFELENGNGNAKEYYKDLQIRSEGQYRNGVKNGKGKNIIIKVIYILKENI